MPIKLELITTPMLTRVKTIELSRLGVANAFKKNTNEKKFGIPNTAPQSKFLIFKKLNCFLANRIKIPVVVALKNNIRKNKIFSSFGI